MLPAKSRTWQALTSHLLLASGTDVLFLITPDTTNASACRKLLASSAVHGRGSLIHFQPDIAADPASLVTCLESALHTPAAGAFWIQAPVDVSHETIPAAQAAWDRAFAALSSHRNHLLRNLPAPLILAGSPWLFLSFRSYVPDWFSIRTGVFNLLGDLTRAVPPYEFGRAHFYPPPRDIPEKKIQLPVFPPDPAPASSQVLKASLATLKPPQTGLLQTLGWLDPAQPVPLWLLTTHPALPDDAGLPETLDALVRSHLLSSSEDGQWLRLHPSVSTAISGSLFKEEDRLASLGNAFEMFCNADTGNPADVRSWPKWDLLQPHADALCAHATDAPAPEHLSWLLNRLGLLFHTKALQAEAEKHLRRALKIDRATFGDDHPRVATCLDNVAYLLHDTNRLAEAEPLMRDALRIDCATYGNDHPIVAARLHNLATLLSVTNRLSEAEPLMRDGLRIDRVTYGDDHPEVALCLKKLAQLLIVTNRLDEAEPLLREALRIDRAAFGDDDPDVGRDIDNLAGLLKSTNRLAEAESLMRDALRIYSAACDDGDPYFAILLNKLAQLLQDSNRLSEAEPLYRRALRVLLISLGPKHPYTLTAGKSLDQLLVQMRGGE